MKNKQYCFSTDGENFSPLLAETEQEAIKELERTYTDVELKNIEIGVIVPVATKEVIPELAEGVINEIADYAYCNYGEHAEDYLSGLPEGAEIKLSEMLNKTVLEWIEMFKLEPTFFQVADICHADAIVSEMNMTLFEWVKLCAIPRKISRIILDWYNGCENNTYELDEEQTFGDTPENFTDAIEDYPFIFEMLMREFHKIEYNEDENEILLTYYND